MSDLQAPPGVPGWGLVIRSPKRGRAHRVAPDWEKWYWSERTCCGLPTLNMTERIPVETTAPEDRCVRCWPQAIEGDHHSQEGT